jgi:hypothetical protein
MNPLKERELELRGLAIKTIENLGAFQGGYDCLNLSENALTTLANLPLCTSSILFLASFQLRGFDQMVETDTHLWSRMCAALGRSVRMG